MPKGLISLIQYGLSIRFIRFLLVGGLNTLFGYGIFALFLLIGLHYTLAGFLATIAGVIFNFNTTGRLVFKRNKWGLIFRFTSVYLITYLLNMAGIWAFEQVEVKPLVSGFILLLPMAVTAYFLQKTLVFQVLPKES